MEKEYGGGGGEYWGNKGVSNRGIDQDIITTSQYTVLEL